MYKYHLRQTWRVSKNLRPEEALAMGRVKAVRDTLGITSEFWQDHRLITPAKLERYLRLNHQVAEKLQEHSRTDHLLSFPVEALLPRGIIVLDPMAPLPTCTDLDESERLIHGVKQATDSLLRRGTEKSFVQEITDKVFESLDAWVELEKHQYGDPNTRQRLLQSFFRHTHLLLRGSGLFFYYLYFLQRMVFRADRPEVGRVFLDYLIRITLQKFGQRHPYCALLSAAVGIVSPQSRRTAIVKVERALAVTRDCYEHHIGLTGGDTFSTYIAHALWEVELGDKHGGDSGGALKGRIDKLFAGVDTERSLNHPGRNVLLLLLAKTYQRRGQHLEATEILDTLRGLSNRAIMPEAKGDVLSMLAEEHKAMGDLASAEELLTEGMQVCKSSYGLGNADTIDQMLQLRSFLACDGRISDELEEDLAKGVAAIALRCMEDGP